MGDRANVAIKQWNEDRVYIYVHGRGTDLPKLVQTGLKLPQARNRYSDASYLTRIIIDHLSKEAGGGPGNETGMGVSTTFGDDNQGWLLVVDGQKQVVYFERAPRYDDEGDPIGEPERLPDIAFKEFFRSTPEWPERGE